MLKTYILGILFIAVTGAVTGCDSNGRQANPSGTLEAVEVDLAPSIGGRVLTVKPKLGDKVAMGDTLLVIDTELLALQKKQAETGLLAISAQQRVLEERRETAKINRDFTLQTVTRLQALVTGGTVTQQQLDEATNRRDIAQQQINEIGLNISALSAEIAKIRATTAIYDRQLKDGILIAPVNGTVIVRSIEPGEMVTPQTTTFRIADMSTLELRFYLNSTDLSKVTVGQALPVAVDAFPGQRINGTVSWVSPTAEFTPKNVQTRSARTQLVYAVKLKIDNTNRKLTIGMPAEVLF